MATVFKIDDLIKDSEVWRSLGVTSMTLWRWTHEERFAHLKFPPVIKIGDRNYRSRSAVNKFVERMDKQRRKHTGQIVRDIMKAKEQVEDFIGDDRRISGVMRKRK